MIKLKRDLNCIASEFDLAHCLKLISQQECTTTQYENPRKKRDVMAQSRRTSQAEGSPSVESVSYPTESPTGKDFTHDGPSTSSLGSINAPNNKDEALKKISDFLDKMEDMRRINELIYGYKESNEEGIGVKKIGIEAARTPGYYKKNLESTLTRNFSGWAEFGISYDNRIFLNSKLGSSSEFKLNHQTMGCGTFLKAVGRIRVATDTEQGTTKVYISPDSVFITVNPNNSAIILFTMQLLGIPLTNGNFFIEEKEGEFTLLNDSYLENLHACFPAAEKIAKDREIVVSKKLTELFFSIDDEILSSRNQKIIKTLDEKSTALKLNIIDFLLLSVKHNLNLLENKQPPGSEQAEETAEQNTSTKNNESDSETLFECYEKIMVAIQQSSNEDILKFLENEMTFWFYYLTMLSSLAEKEKLKEIGEVLHSYKNQPATIARRVFVENSQSKRFVQSYRGDPIQTCIYLLRDYTKGGVWGRFFRGAWNRHHITAVDNLLEKYDTGQLTDDLSISDIYQILFESQDSLINYSGKKGTLYKRLLFCASLNNAIEDETEILEMDPLVIASSRIIIPELEQVNTDCLIPPELFSKPGPFEQPSIEQEQEQERDLGQTLEKTSQKAQKSVAFFQGSPEISPSQEEDSASTLSNSPRMK